MDTAKAIWGALWPTFVVVVILMILASKTWSDDCIVDYGDGLLINWCIDLGGDTNQVPWEN